MKKKTNTCVVRLRRAEGQLTRVLRDLDRDAACVDVLPQLLAIRGAVDGAVRSYLESALTDCAATVDQKSSAALIKALLKYT
jgi:DNA-binding FrmR family transcriptional regulator